MSHTENITWAECDGTRKKKSFIIFSTLRWCHSSTHERNTFYIFNLYILYLVEQQLCTSRLQLESRLRGTTKWRLNTTTRALQKWPTPLHNAQLVEAGYARHTRATPVHSKKEEQERESASTRDYTVTVRWDTAVLSLSNRETVECYFLVYLREAVWKFWRRIISEIMR